MSSAAPAHVEGIPIEKLNDMLWIGDIPKRGAAIAPNRNAIIFPDRGRTLSYAELDRRCDALAALLHEYGLRADDRVAYLGRNSDVYLPVMLGALRARVVLVPLNWRLSEDEIRYQMHDSESKLLLCDPDFSAVAERACRALKNPPRILLTESDDTSLLALTARPAASHPVPHERDQVVLQIYTSGTTGKPKGVLLSHGALSIARHIDLMTPELAYLPSNCLSLSAMPNFHIGGMGWMLMTLTRFGTIVLTADPSPPNMLKLMRDYRTEFSFIIPSVIRTIVDALHASKEAPPSIKGIVYGAMPIGERLLGETMALLNCKLLQLFGMTETGGSATYLAPEQHNPENPKRLKSVGKPYGGISIEIRGPDRRLLKVGEHGEIWIKSPTNMLGYWKLPEKTAESLIDGWYATGDGGYLDEEGFLYLTDRIKDMIVTGGENVYPVEVEEILRQHPAVQDAAVVGVPDAQWGEKVTAVVELRPSQTVDENELRGFVRERIAGYKCPKAIHFATTLPRTASGKIRRVELRDQLKKNSEPH